MTANQQKFIRDQVSDSTWRVVKAICWFVRWTSDKNSEFGYCYASQKKLAAIAGISDRQLRRKIGELVRDGFGTYEKNQSTSTHRFQFAENFREEAVKIGRTLRKIGEENILAYFPKKIRSRARKASTKTNRMSAPKQTKMSAPSIKKEEKKNEPNSGKTVSAVPSALKNFPLSATEKQKLSELGSQEEVTAGVALFQKAKLSMSPIRNLFGALRLFIQKITQKSANNNSTEAFSLIPERFLPIFDRQILAAKFSDAELRDAVSALESTYGRKGEKWWKNSSIRSLGGLINQACRQKFRPNLTKEERCNKNLNFDIVETVRRVQGDDGFWLSISKDDILLKNRNGEILRRENALVSPKIFLKFVVDTLEKSFNIFLEEFAEKLNSCELLPILEEIRAEKNRVLAEEILSKNDNLAGKIAVFKNSIDLQDGRGVQRFSLKDPTLWLRLSLLEQFA